MLSIAICDDDEKLCFEIENMLIKHAKEVTLLIKTEVFFSGQEFYNSLKNGDYFDMVYLDIEMSPVDGVEIGLKIRDELKNNSIQIIYISSHIEHALRLFSVRPKNFLIKPLDSEKIIGAVDQCITLTAGIVKTFEFNVDHEVHKVLVSDIIYFSSDDRLVNIYMENREPLTFYGSLGTIFEENQFPHFIRIHRSFLVNYDKIAVIFNDDVQMMNKDILPLSRKKKRELKDMGREIL